MELFLSGLRAEKLSHIFGVPGGLLHPFFAAVDEANDFRMVVAKHEGGAAFMADGFTRTTGNIACVASTAGPGATNLLTGVAVAYADSIPMLVLTGQVPTSSLGKGASQDSGPEDMDLVSMFRPVTKYSASVQHASRIGFHIKRAFRSALSGRPGPVHLNIPVDVWSGEIDNEELDPARYRAGNDSFDRHSVEAAATVLVNAKNPVFIAGSGVELSGARQEFRTLAELLPAKVVTSPRAKGVFSEHHPLSRGVLGYGGHKAATDLVTGPSVDVLFAVGASLNETTTCWNPAIAPSDTLIQLDIDAERFARAYPIDIPLLGDAHTILRELIYNLHRKLRSGYEIKSQVQIDYVDSGVRPDTWFEKPTLRRSNATPLTPQSWRKVISKSLPKNAVVYSDVGGHMLFNIHDLTIHDEQKFVVNMGFASMGHGTCAPIGSALADKAPPIVAIIGDGCFKMNGMELLTAVEYDANVTWIIENNYMHGITWHGSKLVGSNPLECVRTNSRASLAEVAESLGAHAVSVTSVADFKKAFDHATKHQGPNVIEVLVDGSIAPPLTARAKSVDGRGK